MFQIRKLLIKSKIYKSVLIVLLTIAALGVGVATYIYLSPPVIFIKEKQVVEPLTFYSLKGDKVSVNDLPAGKLLVNFWATWCAPCVKELPELSAMQKEFPDKFTLVTISIDSLEDTKLFLEKSNIEGIHLFATHKDDLNTITAFENSLDMMKKLGNWSDGIPFTVMIDGENERTIVFHKVGEISLEWLREYLQSL